MLVMTVNQLKAVCQANKLPLGGKKKDLQEQIKKELEEGKQL